MSGGNYVRVYTSVIGDDKFKGISLSSLGAWLKLLLYADEMYPAPAPLPRWLDDETMNDLADRRIIDIVDDDHYRVHGLDAERERRSAAAAIGGRARAATAQQTVSERSANGMPSQAKPSLAKPSQANARARGDEAANAYSAVKGGQVSAKALAFVDDLVRDFGDEEVAQAIGQEAVASGVDREFLSRVKTRCLLVARQESHVEAERRKRAAIEEVQALKDAMPEEARKANLVRLGDMMREKGLI